MSTELIVKPLRALGKLVRQRRGTTSFHAECTDLDLAAWDPARFPGVAAGEDASALIHDELASGRPSMICRLGSTELATMSSTLTPLTLANAWKLATGDAVVRDIGMHAGLVRALGSLSGFFPTTEDAGRRFVDLMLAALDDIDVLGTWCKQEVQFEAHLRGARRVRFRDLEPYMHAHPWSRVLAGKRVLVVHPFAELIAQQYAQRERLFANPDVLPAFDLHVITAVQSIANNPVPFDSWFDALAHMERQMSAVDFDVAIVGCGAYGLPLAAHAKRMGRQGVHLGGQTQLLFGIKGKRWETGHERISALFNAHWVYPREEDRPKNFRVVEGGAYW